MEELFFKTNLQKILKYMTEKPGKEFLSKEIQIAAKVSKAGANFALNDLVKNGLINREQKGKSYLYSIKDENPTVKQLKVFSTILYLTPLFEKIREKANKVILYGSAGRGENTEDSDIDLFIVTNFTEEIERLLQKTNFHKKVQAIFRTPLKYIEMEKTDASFFREVERGITLWEE